MSERSGIFAGDDPFEITRRWLSEAEACEPSDPNAAALATADEACMPDVRIVLIKAIEDDALVFFTNYESRKGRQLEANPKAALDFHWKCLQRQIRVRGDIVKESPQASDEYYNSRPLGSRIGAWASRQSRPLSSKAALLKDVAAAQLRQGTRPARPPHWGGYRLLPLEFEFWAAGEFRLHDRFRWSRTSHSDGWEISRLYP